MLVLLLTLILAFIVACGGDGSHDTKSDKFSVAAYEVRPGDTFEYQTSMEASYSNDKTITGTLKEVESFSQVDTIPNKYSYSGDMTGPYILKTKLEDGIVDGYDYMAFDGTDIVSDDLETYTRADAQTITGSDEPEDVSIGDVFTYYEESTLFDSNTAEKVGTEITDGIFTAMTEETIAVPAGTFHCLKLDFELQMSKNLWGVSDTMSTTGSAWYDIENGFVPKLIGVMDMTINEMGLTANATVERVLTDYEIGVVAQLDDEGNDTLIDKALFETASLCFARKAGVIN